MMNDDLIALYWEEFGHINGAEFLHDPQYVEQIREYTKLILANVIDVCELECADYKKYAKTSTTYEDKSLYMKGAAACDAIKFEIKRRFGV